MVNKYQVEGFEAFVEKLDSLKSTGKSIYIHFSGSKDASTGKSWCPDCVVADPVVNSAVDKLAADDSSFLYVGVGPRSFWKDLNNPFRKDPRTRLNSVPTLVKFGTSQRLEEAQCANANMVEMVFEN